MIGGLMKSASRFAVIAAAGFFMGGIALTPATAADLGGDCCADLEERVAELEATTVRKGNRKVSLKLSGQVNKALLYWDDGDTSDVYVVDNIQSSTRFRFTGSAAISSDWSAGFLIEIELDSAGSASVSQANDDGTSTNDALQLRKAQWWIKSKSLGKISLGQGSPATDDNVLVNVAGTGVVATIDAPLWNGNFAVSGGLLWKDFLSGETAIDTSRRDIIRYDSPTIAGFTLSASWGEDDFWDVALWWKGKAGDFVAAASVGYLEDDDEVLGANVDFSEWKGSGSIMHVPTGLFVHGAFVFRDIDDPAVAGDEEEEMWYVQAGIKRKFSSLGATAFYGEYGNYDTLTSQALNNGNGDETQIWGLGVVQWIDAAAMELYAGYRHYEIDDDALGVLGVDEFDAVLAGARIKF